MTKKKLTLTVDEFIINEAKRMGINISKFLEDMLAEKIGYEKRWVKRK